MKKTLIISSLKKIPTFFRTFWAVTLISSIICTLTLIFKLGIKMNSFPIVAYLSDTSVLVSEIYFPAVTVCPDFMPFLPTINPIDPKQMNKFYRYEKHKGIRYYYENEEYANEISGEQKIMLNYTDILDKIDNHEINPKDLEIKM